MNKLVLLVFLLLPGCAVPMFVAGVASVGINETTGKSMSDHVVSGINGQDCRIARSLSGQDMCQARVQLEVTESQYRPSRTADIEARYR